CAAYYYGSSYFDYW
nr:immunoglobulin heavy chain junction region [Mus musculus]